MQMAKMLPKAFFSWWKIYPMFQFMWWKLLRKDMKKKLGADHSWPSKKTWRSSHLQNASSSTSTFCLSWPTSWWFNKSTWRMVKRKGPRVSVQKRVEIEMMNIRDAWKYEWQVSVVFLVIWNLKWFHQDTLVGNLKKVPHLLTSQFILGNKKPRGFASHFTMGNLWMMESVPQSQTV